MCSIFPLFLHSFSPSFRVSPFLFLSFLCHFLSLFISFFVSLFVHLQHFLSFFFSFLPPSRSDVLVFFSTFAFISFLSRIYLSIFFSISRHCFSIICNATIAFVLTLFLSHTSLLFRCFLPLSFFLPFFFLFILSLFPPLLVLASSSSSPLAPFSHFIFLDFISIFFFIRLNNFININDGTVSFVFMLFLSHTSLLL